MSQKNGVMWAIAIVGGFFLVNKIVKAKGEAALPALYGGMISEQITVPPNKRWIVELRNGNKTEMSSTQLQNALEAKAVKTYAELPTTV